MRTPLEFHVCQLQWPTFLTQTLQLLTGLFDPAELGRRDVPYALGSAHACDIYVQIF